jgi:hypothetical protein
MEAAACNDAGGHAVEKVIVSWRDRYSPMLVHSALKVGAAILL